MNSKNKVKELVFAALLIAFAIIIPIQFGFLRVNIPPFTATIASHVPTFIAMLISPMVAVVVGIGSTLGFFMGGLPAPVIARASTHIIVGLVGALIVLKSRNFKMAVLLTGPIHGILEALVLIPFVGASSPIIIVTLVGAIAHHYVDGTIAYVLVKAIAKSRNRNIYTTFIDNKAA